MDNTYDSTYDNSRANTVRSAPKMRTDIAPVVKPVQIAVKLLRARMSVIFLPAKSKPSASPATKEMSMSMSICPYPCQCQCQ